MRLLKTYLNVTCFAIASFIISVSDFNGGSISSSALGSSYFGNELISKFIGSS